MGSIPICLRQKPCGRVSIRTCPQPEQEKPYSLRPKWAAEYTEARQGENRHFCKNCFNSEAWDFSYGNLFTDEILQELVTATAPDHITGFSVLGGEPFEPENQEGVLKVVREIKTRFPQKNIWIYTGFLFDEQLLKGTVGNLETVKEILKYTDVLVDGKFVE